MKIDTRRIDHAVHALKHQMTEYVWRIQPIFELSAELGEIPEPDISFPIIEVIKDYSDPNYFELHIPAFDFEALALRHKEIKTLNAKVNALEASNRRYATKVDNLNRKLRYKGFK